MVVSSFSVSSTDDRFLFTTTSPSKPPLAELFLFPLLLPDAPDAAGGLNMLGCCCCCCCAVAVGSVLVVTTRAFSTALWKIKYAHKSYGLFHCIEVIIWEME